MASNEWAANNANSHGGRRAVRGVGWTDYNGRRPATGRSLAAQLQACGDKLGWRVASVGQWAAGSKSGSESRAGSGRVRRTAVGTAQVGRKLRAKGSSGQRQGIAQRTRVACVVGWGALNKRREREMGSGAGRRKARSGEHRAPGNGGATESERPAGCTVQRAQVLRKTRARMRRTVGRLAGGGYDGGVSGAPRVRAWAQGQQMGGGGRRRVLSDAGSGRHGCGRRRATRRRQTRAAVCELREADAGQQAKVATQGCAAFRGRWSLGAIRRQTRRTGTACTASGSSATGATNGGPGGGGRRTLAAVSGACGVRRPTGGLWWPGGGTRASGDRETGRGVCSVRGRRVLLNVEGAGAGAGGGGKRGAEGVGSGQREACGGGGVWRAGDAERQRASGCALRAPAREAAAAAARGGGQRPEGSGQRAVTAVCRPQTAGPRLTGSGQRVFRWMRARTAAGGRVGQVAAAASGSWRRKGVASGRKRETVTGQRWATGNGRGATAGNERQEAATGDRAARAGPVSKRGDACGGHEQRAAWCVQDVQGRRATSDARRQVAGVSGARRNAYAWQALLAAVGGGRRESGVPRRGGVWRARARRGGGGHREAGKRAEGSGQLAVNGAWHAACLSWAVRRDQWAAGSGRRVACAVKGQAARRALLGCAVGVAGGVPLLSRMCCKRGEGVDRTSRGALMPAEPATIIQPGAGERDVREEPWRPEMWKHWILDQSPMPLAVISNWQSFGTVANRAHIQGLHCRSSKPAGFYFNLQIWTTLLSSGWTWKQHTINARFRRGGKSIPLALTSGYFVADSTSIRACVLESKRRMEHVLNYQRGVFFDPEVSARSCRMEGYLTRYYNTGFTIPSIMLFCIPVLNPPPQRADYPAADIRGRLDGPLTPCEMRTQCALATTFALGANASAMRVGRRIGWGRSNVSLVYCGQAPRTTGIKPPLQESGDGARVDPSSPTLSGVSTDSTAGDDVHMRTGGGRRAWFRWRVAGGMQREPCSERRAVGWVERAGSEERAAGGREQPAGGGKRAAISNQRARALRS
ncbi:hypothetical protein GGX14DRAFT_618457 [Mycena pura]|uniref:Uncharacterized protein n=1 Tax=Mycena pura TaxID=153505 RepID=A0AAD6UKB1_9AGAR|nr:hypothetical protein GGX14DRAFT_618457 [Mycena pura]